MTSPQTNQTHYISQQALQCKELNFIVVGAGGTGSQIITGLASMAHAIHAMTDKRFRVTAYDPDTVSANNIGRQPYFPADIGRHKTDCLISRINMAYGLDFQSMPVRFDGSIRTRHFRSSMDVLISCVDSVASRQVIAMKAQDYDYWLDLGNSSHTGQWVLGSTSGKPELPMPDELLPELTDPSKETPDEPSCSMAESLSKQSLFINKALTSQALACLWDLIFHGQISIHGQFMDLKSGRANPININPTVWKSMGYKPQATS